MSASEPGASNPYAPPLAPQEAPRPAARVPGAYQPLSRLAMALTIVMALYACAKIASIRNSVLAISTMNRALAGQHVDRAAFEAIDERARTSGVLELALASAAGVIFCFIM